VHFSFFFQEFGKSGISGGKMLDFWRTTGFQSILE
jgi:hypothetical protein